MEANIVGKRIGFLKYRPSAFFGTFTVDDEIDPLVARQVSDDLGIDPRDGLELARPVAFEMRPREPSGLVRLPFGGHAVALCGGWEFRASGRRFGHYFVRSLSVQHAAGDRSVAVDAAVAQEGPVAANVFQVMQVDLAKQNLFLIVGTLGEDTPEGVAKE